MSMDTAASEPVSLADSDRDQIRELLTRYRLALDACEALAMALLESVRPDAAPLDGDQAHERRQSAADAIALAHNGQAYLEHFWRTAGLERRLAAPETPLPATVAKDRRRKPPKTPRTAKARAS
jgi:hypothetical protein